MGNEPTTIALPELVSVKDLAEAIQQPVTAVIAELMKNGVMATINEDIDYETAAVIASDLGVDTEPAKAIAAEVEQENQEHDGELQPRPPVVAVLGHVDHGKTSLLDALRETNVTATESGGITQHIGAYQVEVQAKDAKKSRLVTMLDTPGHEAFTAMRAHGTRLTDVAILVVAADEGVKPQTIEAVQHINDAKVPFVVAVTKSDREGADLNKVKQELAAHEVVAEDWGGAAVFVPTSAKTGEGLQDLLEMVLLVSDLASPQADPNGPFRGVVIESRLSRSKGAVATILVKNGTLKIGDYVVIDDSTGRIRLMEDSHGTRVEAAPPGMPIQVAGLGAVPGFAAKVTREADEKSAKATAALNRRRQSARGLARPAASLDALHRAVDKGKVRQLPIILVADVKGSLEAIEHSLAQLPQDEVAVQIVSTAVGSISESDVRQAASGNAMIIGFKARTEATATKAAKQQNVQITTYDVIYELLDDIREALESLLEPEVVENEIGTGKVLQIFRTTKKSQIAGCKVEDKKFVAGVEYRIKETEETGKVVELRRVADVVEEVPAGTECGVTLEGPHVAVDQHLMLFRTTTKRRTLGS